MNPQIGQTWGRRSLRFNLPAAVIQLTGLSAAQHASLRDIYPGFIDETVQGAGKYSIVCRAYRLDQAPAVPLQALTLDEQYAPRKIRRSDGIELTGINFEARVQLNPSLTPASLGVVEEHELAQANVIENFLRVFAAHQALKQGGAVLHSAGLVFDGRAYIFSGRSNAGKTTLTRKAHQKGAWVLSDDINLLLPGREGYEAFAVPFTGEFGRTLDHQRGRDSYPVAGVVLLEQGDRLKTQQVRAADALARLLTGCPFVNTDAEESANLFDVLTELVARVPVVGLQCRRDDEIEVIMDAVKSTIAHARLPS